VGSIYHPKYRNAGGEKVEQSVLWLKYRDARGVLRRQSSGTSDVAEARRQLKRLEGDAVAGKVTAPRADKVTISDLANDLRAEYAANGRRSAKRLEGSLGHVLEALGHHRAIQLTTAEVTAYTLARHQEGAANATVNRELAALKRMFTLALKGEKISRRPYIAMLHEDNVRKGFFEFEAYQATRRHLPEALRPVIDFAYITGWRMKAEILPLQWNQVDLVAGTVRLEVGTTKNREGRTFYLTPELRACLEGQRAATAALGMICPWVFHRAGKPIKSFRRAWKSACIAAGVSEARPHDFRRTAVRNLERAGVPRSAAMAMVGHKTESVYRRYAIVDAGMLREGAAKLAALHAGQGSGQGEARQTRLSSVVSSSLA
jgi:integrase